MHFPNFIAFCQMVSVVLSSARRKWEFAIIHRRTQVYKRGEKSNTKTPHPFLVVLDNNGYSKGYGFIRFGCEKEQQTALASMMGVSGLGSKPIRVSALTV